MAMTEQERTFRAVAFMGVALVLGGILGGRLYHLQLAEGDTFLKRAEGNRLRVIPQTAPRGVIKDRHGRVLASNRLSYSLALYPSKMTREQIDQVLARLKALVNIDIADAKKKLERLGYHSPHPIKIRNDLDSRTIALVAENQGDLPGVSIEPDTIRYYPHGRLAAHMLGYTGEITDDELTRLKDHPYRQGDVIGKTGIERVHDTKLRGTDGSRQVEVDARGRPGQTLRIIPAIPGEDMQLYLDLDLQRVAEAALDEKKLTGAIVALNPQNGEILALASRPAFDPNIFSRKVKAHEWKELQEANYPFVNRALSAYPPGSIYKIPMAMAALASGKATPGRLFQSTGSLRVGNRIFHDWYAPGFGTVDLVKSLQWSIDTVYYQLGVEMGPDTMAKHARDVGFGEPTGYELGGESAGLIPDRAWKKRVLKDKWWPGDSANVSIGQGWVSVTPMQAVVMTSAYANGGKVVVPRVVDTGSPAPPPRKVLTWNPKHLEVVRKGLRLVVSEGTGTAVDVPGKSVSGKSGSAESGKKKTHAWFVCYAPEKDASIAVVAFAEAAGHGGDIAAPMARKVLDQYFGIKDGKIRRAPIAD